MIVIVVVFAVLPFEIPGPATASGAAYPVPYTLASGLAAELLSPGASPPGANDWSCRPSAAHPEPVVLLHGLFGNMTDNWQTISPLLADNGYCVFALTYGTLPGATFPLDQFGGLVPMEESAQTISAFVDRVLAATGAREVDIVGHSEGATLPFYYVEFLNGAAKVHRYVGIAPVYHGTTLFGLASVASKLAVAFPSAAQAVGQICGSCQEFLGGSDFMQKLDANAAVPGVTYTNIMTRLDQAVVPYTSGMLAGPNVTNLVVQDQCGLDLSDHLTLAADPIVGRDVLNALDPSHAEVPTCTLVLPFVG
jgi:triacylglycerol esterase/lipase EstA (alpha/beta hydrolase family)